MSTNRLFPSTSSRLIPVTAITTIVIASGLMAGSASAATAVRPANNAAPAPTVKTSTATPRTGPHRRAYDPVTGTMVTVYKPFP